MKQTLTCFLALISLHTAIPLAAQVSPPLSDPDSRSEDIYEDDTPATFKAPIPLAKGHYPRF
jgi:hypothetical protein